MSPRRRGIRLKQLTPLDPGMRELRDTHLGPAGQAPAPPAPDPADVARMVRTGLEDALGLLNEGLRAAGAGGERGHAAPEDPPSPGPRPTPGAGGPDPGDSQGE